MAVSADTGEYLARIFDATELLPTVVHLPQSNRAVGIATMRRSERLWAGAPPEFLGLVPNKPTLELNGRPIWAEFILLRSLESDGWKGVWVKNWGGRAFWRSPGERIELPPSATLLFRRIGTHTGGHGGGCWDIFAWRGDDFLFIESKKHKRDRLRETQRTWLECSLEEGVQLPSFAIVEWTLR